MICPKCGSEIKENMLYCSVCGEEIKLVNDYDAAVDDTLNLSITGVIEEIDIENNAKAPTRELISNTLEAFRGRKNKAGNKKSVKVSKRSIAAFAIVFCLFLLGIIILGININRYYSFDYQYEKALEEYDNSQYEQSVRTIRHALSIDNTSAKIKLLLVDNYLELDKYDEALAVLEELLSEYPDDENLYGKIVQIYEKKGDAAAISLLVERADIDSFTDNYSEYVKPVIAFSLPSGNYDEEVSLSIEYDTGCTVYYTLDGSSVDKTKLIYTEPILLDGGEHTVNAVCYNENGVMSDEISGNYIIEFAVPDLPVLSVQSGEYTEPKLIGVTYGNSSGGADSDSETDLPGSFKVYKCYYTIDGNDPTEEDNLYDAPIAMYIGNHNYKFAVISDKGISSEIYNLDVTLNVVNLVDMGTAKANLEIWLNSHGLNEKGATYKCEQAYIKDGVTYYLLNEYDGEKRTGGCYGVDVITGMLYKAKRNAETGEYTLEPVIKPL